MRRAAGRGLRAAHLARSFGQINASGHFDVAFYAAQTGLRFRHPRQAIWHYLRTGRYQDFSPHPLYEPASHIRDTRRRRVSRVAPFALFLQQARRPKVAPHYLFSTGGYLAEHPEAEQHRYGAWGHFLDHAGPDTLLPVPSTLDGAEITWTDWRRTAVLHAARWQQHDALTREPRLTDHLDLRAERALRAWARTQPLPPALPDGDRPLVSVVTAVRNRPQQVLDAIASVTAQSLQDWELLVIDDGSTDDTPAVVEEVARYEPRLRVLRRPHGGVSAARNAALDQARGRYIAWLDSDNVWHPEMLEVMVKALHGRGLRAAYCACSFVTAEGDKFRSFAGGLEHLQVGNFVDLNVLVVERDLLVEAGGFDPGLPRAVDYDLVYRLAERVEVPYLPLLGTTYHDDGGDPDRISVKELKSWNYLVRDRHVVPWARLASTVERRAPERVSVVVPVRGQWLQARRTVSSLLARSGGADLEIVVVDAGSVRPAYLLVAAVECLSPRVRVLRTPVNYNLGPTLNVGLAQTTGATVVVCPAGVEVGPGWLEPLLQALADPEVAAAGPLVLSDDGLVASAGVLVPAEGGLPLHLLRDHPVQDAEALATAAGDATVAVPALGRAGLAVRARDLVAAGGFDPLYVDAFEDADLCLRLVRQTGRRCVLVPASRVVQPAVALSARAQQLEDNVRLFRTRWAGAVDDGARLWALAGLRVDGYRTELVATSDDEDDELGPAPLVRPVLTRTPPTRSDDRPDGVPAQRWVLELPDPPAAGDGDDGLLAAANDLVDRLRDLGQPVVVRPSSTRYRSPAYLDDVVLIVGSDTIREPVAHSVNVLLTAAASPGTAGERDFDLVTALDLVGQVNDAVARTLLARVRDATRSEGVRTS